MEVPKLLETIRDGTELEILTALQKKVADTIDNTTSARDIAALARQLREVTERVKELELINSAEDGVLDQIIEKHKNHRVRNEARQRIEE